MFSQQDTINKPDPDFVYCPGCGPLSNDGCLLDICNHHFANYTNVYDEYIIDCRFEGNSICFCEWDKPLTIDGFYHQGTPTLFHPDFASVLGVPGNIKGNESDHSTSNNTSGYMGITTYAGNNWRDYLMLKNGYQLTAGNTYQITFFVSLAEIGQYATPIQVYIGPQHLNFVPGSTSNINMTLPAYHFKTTPVITTHNGWHPVSFTYTATTSGIHQIIIGNFHNNLTTLRQLSTADVLSGVGRINDYAYYYIDDFNITRINLPQEACCNFDHHVGNQYDYGGIYFDDTLSQYNVLPGEKVFMNGNSWITQDVTYTNVDFVFGVQANLFIDQGINVVFDNCHLYGCYAMWEGIQSFSGNTSLSFHNCVIEDMTTGIKVTSGSPLQIVNTTFKNNFVSISMDNYLSTWPFSMRGSTFKQDGNLKPFVSIYPYQYTYFLQPEVHIELTQIGWVPVVSPPGSSNRNLFMHSRYGIRAYNAGLTVSNARFQQIKSGGQGWAISVKASNDKLYGIKINDQWGEFRVHQCDNGIVINGGYYTEISKGRFFNIANTAIKQHNTAPWPWWNSTTAQINLSQNDIRNATIGIDLYNTGNTLSLVDNNSIANTSYRKKSVAIRTQNIFGKIAECKDTRLLTIRNNTTTRFKTGIQSDICNCLEISNNAVNLNNPNWDQAHGIWVRSSLGALINGNTVTGSGMDWYSQGIRLEFSPQTTISCNMVTNTENALWIHNNNIFSFIIGNTLQQYKNGLHLTYNGILGSQFISGTEYFDLFNSFTVNGNIDNDLYTSLSTNGTTSPLASFQYLNFNSINELQSQPILLIGATNNSYSSYCRVNNPPNTISTFNFLGPYRHENRWINKWKHKEFFGSLGDSLAVEFPHAGYVSQMNDSIAYTQINQLYAADSLMSHKKWNEATLLLQQITATEPTEEFWKSAHQVMLKYIPTLLQGNDTVINAMDSVSLYAMANQCPYQYGDAVIQSRIFILRHINPSETFDDNCVDSNTSSPRLSQIENQQGNLGIYPNPGSDELYVKFNSTYPAELLIYDLHGRIVIEEKMYSSERMVPVRELRPGCYYVVVRNEVIYEGYQWIKR